MCVARCIYPPEICSMKSHFPSSSVLEQWYSIAITPFAIALLFPLLDFKTWLYKFWKASMRKLTLSIYFFPIWFPTIFVFLLLPASALNGIVHNLVVPNSVLEKLSFSELSIEKMKFFTQSSTIFFFFSVVFLTLKVA